jgi:hypothetical protein
MPASLWPTVRPPTPESQGLSSAAILAFVEALETKIDSPNSVMVLRHGPWWPRDGGGPLCRNIATCSFH